MNKKPYLKAALKRHISLYNYNNISLQKEFYSLFVFKIIQPKLYSQNGLIYNRVRG